MTAEILHDALTLLPAELVAQTEKKRSRKGKHIPWQRFAAMAACFALLLGLGTFWIRSFSAKGGLKAVDMVIQEAAEVPAEAPAAAAPAENGDQEMAAEEVTGAAPGFSEAHWVQTPCGDAVNLLSQPNALLITGRDALETYVQENTAQDLTRLRNHEAFLETDWFDRYDLILVGVPAGAEPQLVDIRQEDAGWILILRENTQAEESAWHLLLTAQKGLLSQGAQIRVDFAQ